MSDKYAPHDKVFSFPLNIFCERCERYVPLLSLDLDSAIEQTGLYWCTKCDCYYEVEAPKSWVMTDKTSFFLARSYQVVWCC